MIVSSASGPPVPRERRRGAPSRLAALLAIFPLSFGCSGSTPGNHPAAGAGTAGSSANAGAAGQPPTSGGAGQSQGGGETTAGSAGTTTTGGAGSSAGGTAGTAGGGQSGGGAEVARPSAGCQKQPDLTPGQFSETTAMGRKVWIRLPTDYDPERAYPVIFVWKGCGAAGVNAYGIDKVAGNDAIIAQGDFAPGQTCYDTSDGAMYVDLPVFDALLAQIGSNYCADQAHVFSVGFSSGAWLTQLLACQRGDVLRGIGTIAGAFKPAFMKGAATCVGDGLSAFMVSDLADHENPFYDEDKDGDSVEVAVNHWLVANHCTEQMWTLTNGTPSTPDMAVCREYSNCGKNPVKLCLTDGKGHAAQENLSMPGFWELFQRSLPR